MSILLLFLILITSLSQHPDLPRQNDRRAWCKTAFHALCVHPPPSPPHHHLQPTSTPQVAPSARPGARRSSWSLCPSFSSSSSSSSASPSSPTYLNTPSCSISTTWCTAAFLLSMSIILFLLLLLLITIISNLPQHPELPHQHGFLALYVHPLPPYHYSSSSSSSSPTYLNTPSCPISTAWCTAAFLLSMCPFSLHHMRCGG